MCRCSTFGEGARYCIVVRLTTRYDITAECPFNQIRLSANRCTHTHYTHYTTAHYRPTQSTLHQHSPAGHDTTNHPHATSQSSSHRLCTLLLIHFTLAYQSLSLSYELSHFLPRIMPSLAAPSTPTQTSEPASPSSSSSPPLTPTSSVSSSSPSPVQLEDSEDLLLRENKGRFVLFPIRHADIWQMYKKHEASFWTAEEIDLSQDSKDWATLSSNEQHFVKHVLAFFAASDGIVLENLAEKFITEVQLPEARW